MKKVEVHLSGVKIGEFLTNAEGWSILLDHFFGEVQLIPANQSDWPEATTSDMIRRSKNTNIKISLPG